MNLELRDALGRRLFALDLAYPEAKIAVEYDGQQHRADLQQWAHDIDRGDWLHREGWRVVPVISRGIFLEPGRTVERVAAELASRGHAVPSRSRSEAWRAHFPGRG